LKTLTLKPLFHSLTIKTKVSEILSNNKTRLSINGWYHGPTNFRPISTLELLPEPIFLKEIGPDTFFDWVNERYLNPTNQTDIQINFTETSEIKLENFFNVSLF
jgi:hypothetical protein